MYGFAKKVKSNIKDDELKALKKLAKELFGYTDPDLKKVVKTKKLIEVKCNEKVNT